MLGSPCLLGLVEETCACQIFVLGKATRPVGTARTVKGGEAQGRGVARLRLEMGSPKSCLGRTAAN